MDVKCIDLGKRFQFNWVVRNCNWTFSPNSITGISGRNGSGKSTLIKMLATQLSPSTGKIRFVHDEVNITEGSVFNHLSLVGPYTSLIQEFSLEEQFDFHFKFKNKAFDFSLSDFISILEYESYGNKLIETYSSGMHQRLQLAFALLSDTSLVLLDEPTSFLDFEAKKWFYNLLSVYGDNRTVIIASNDQEDLAVCREIYKMEDLQAVS